MTSLNVALNIEVVGLLPLYDESISLQAVSLCFLNCSFQIYKPVILGMIILHHF